MIRRIAGLLSLLLLALAGSLMGVVAAANRLPSSGLSQRAYPYTANQLKPAQCSGIDITNLITGGKAITGTAGNDLILGSLGHDEILGGDGNDCIVGGRGADKLSGGNGDDVLISSLDNSQLDGGPGIDVCYGFGGKHKVENCETYVP